LMMGLWCGVVSAPALAAELPPALHSLTWLLGSWERTGLEAGQRGNEQWQRQEQVFVGRGSTWRQGRLQFEERLRIERDGGGIYYLADVSGNAAPVRFRLVEQGPDEVVFENPAHDFPQRISYRREGTLLTAVVSDIAGERTQVFQFRQSRPPQE
jgi:hypothetical protein